MFNNEREVTIHKSYTDVITDAHFYYKNIKTINIKTNPLHRTAHLKKRASKRTKTSKSNARPR